MDTVVVVGKSEHIYFCPKNSILSYFNPKKIHKPEIKLCYIFLSYLDLLFKAILSFEKPSSNFSYYIEHVDINNNYFGGHK